MANTTSVTYIFCPQRYTNRMYVLPQKTVDWMMNEAFKVAQAEDNFELFRAAKQKLDSGKELFLDEEETMYIRRLPTFQEEVFNSFIEQFENGN